MESWDSLMHWVVQWLDHTSQLAQRMSLVVVAAFLSIRLGWLRRAFEEVDSGWKSRLAAVTVFGLLAVVGTHGGIPVALRPDGDESSDLLRMLGRHLHVDTGEELEGWLSNSRQPLQESQAAIHFRDVIVIVAGLVGGPWIGGGAGLIAGGERGLLGGFAALPFGLTCPLQGLAAGLVRRRWPAFAADPVTAMAIGLGGVLLQALVLLALARPYDAAVQLMAETALPMALVNGFGCFLFVTVFKDVDRHRLESEARDAQLRALAAQMERERLEEAARQAELRALRAQIEPHFLNNTLTAIQELIFHDPVRANAYVVKLARFFGRTREYANAHSIRLAEELEQLNRYLDFQRLRFPDALVYREDIPARLLDCRVPPRTLQTLVENALTHGYEGNAKAFELRVAGEDQGDSLVLRVSDSGRGMSAGRLAELGQAPVSSERGSGSALYQLARSLELAFGARAKLAFHSQPGEGTEAIVVLPFQSEPW